VAEHHDGITNVLRECEATLRALADQGRLTDVALATFIQLAQSIEREMDRRGDRAAVAEMAVLPVPVRYAVE
jgi:hypothetical protein